MFENLKTQLNQPMKLNKSMNISVLNVLWGILIGEKLSLDDPKWLKTLDLLDEFGTWAILSYFIFFFVEKSEMSRNNCQRN